MMDALYLSFLNNKYPVGTAVNQRNHLYEKKAYQRLHYGQIHIDFYQNLLFKGLLKTLSFPFKY